MLVITRLVIAESHSAFFIETKTLFGGNFQRSSLLVPPTMTVLPPSGQLFFFILMCSLSYMRISPKNTRYIQSNCFILIKKEFYIEYQREWNLVHYRYYFIRWLVHHTNTLHIVVAMYFHLSFEQEMKWVLVLYLWIKIPL